MRKLSDCNFMVSKPYICMVKVWHPSEPRYAWVAAWLASDGNYHLDGDSLYNAEHELGVDSEDMYVNDSIMKED